MSQIKNTEWVACNTPNNVNALESARQCDCCHQACQDLRPNKAYAKVLPKGNR